MQHLDSSLFKAFYWAASELSFTRASQRAGMTQSGISQHISKLENQIGVPLFERINKQVFLTDAGKQLLAYIDKQEDELGALMESIHGDKYNAAGLVKYAMPESCLFTPHFSMLLKKKKTDTEINLNVELCPNDGVFDRLLNREVDFGFVTKKSKNPAIKHEKFAKEEYILVASPKLKKTYNSLQPKDILKLPFISYPGMDVLFEIWSNHFYPKARQLSPESLSIVGTINNLHGAVTMLLEEVGFTIMPSHCAEPWISKGKLLTYTPRKSSMFADIYIVTLNDCQLPTRVSKVIRYFREMKV